MQETDVKKTDPDLQLIFQRLSQQNECLINNISEMEKIGHRLKNTNVPTIEDAKKPLEDKPEPDGLLPDILRQLGFTTLHNKRLEELIKKFNSLI